MAFPVWLNNLIAYCLQIAVLAAAGTLLAYFFRLRVPRVALVYWQLLLLVCLLVPCLQSWRHPVVSPAPSIEMSTSMLSPVNANAVIPANSDRAKQVPWGAVLLILAAGVLLRLLWLIIGFFRLQRFRRKSHLFSEERSTLQDMQWRTGVRVTVLHSGAVHSPVTFGWRSPTIILPLSFKELSESCRQAVLCHELLHVRRHDWILILVEELVRSIFWFHPAIWWLLNRIHLSREQAVDFEVVQLIGSKQPYLDSLLEFAQTHGRLSAVPAPLFLREHHLVERVSLLIKEVSMSRSRLAFSMIGIIALLACVFYLASGCFPLTGTPVYAQAQNGGSEIKAPQEVPAARVEDSASVQEQTVKPGLKPSQASPVRVAEARTSTQEPIPDSNPYPSREQPIRVGGNVAESHLVQSVEPIYPELAKRARVQGKVVMVVTIDEDGNVTDIKVVSGHPLLNDAAVTAVKQWKYSPTLMSDKPVPVIATVTVVFRLDDHQETLVRIDPSGNLLQGNEPFQPEQMLKAGGLLRIFISPATPLGVAEGAIRNLIQEGITNIEVGGPYILYQGQLFYGAAPSFPMSNSGPDREKYAPVDALLEEMSAIEVSYRVFYNAAGEAIGLQRMSGDASPEVDDAIMLVRQEPVMLNGEPVPFMKMIYFSHGR